MKTIVTVLVLSAAALGMAGCSSTNITEWQKAVAGSPGAWTCKVTSIYGTVGGAYVGALPAGTKATASPDGTVTVEVPAK